MSWAGLRPVTPDMLPILGADPDHPSVVYACGHSRNGVLMAPLTGDVVADLVTGVPLSHDLTQFRPARF
jgi:glycine/D-amino acid oxidase-like deaminating enzyme